MENTRQYWKKFLAVYVATALLSVGSGVVTYTAQAKANPQIFDLQAHRGGRDARPENTLAAFAYAMELGVTTLELDMQMTKDGQIVISHNPVLNHNLTKGPDGKYVEAGKYDIRTMNFAELGMFDIGTMNAAAGDYYESHGKTQMAVPGAKIPTLEDVFELANAYGNEKIYFNIETKSYADPADPASKNNPDPEKFVKKVYDIIQKYHMEDRVLLQSFDWRTLQIMHKLDPNITLVALSSEQPSWGWVEGCYLKIGDKKASPWLAGLNINDYHGNYVKAARDIGADVVAPYWEELSPQLVSEAHSLGMKVVPWTVNDRKDMSMLIDMGVDGIITDRPWILRELLLNRGIPVAQSTVNVNSPYHTGTAILAAESKQLSQGKDAAE